MKHAWGPGVTNNQLSIFRGRLLQAAGITLLTGPVLFACSQEVVAFDDGSGGASSSTGTQSSGTQSTTSGVGGGGATSGVGTGGGSTIAVTAVSGVGGGGTSVTSGAGGANATTSVGAGGGGTTVTCFQMQSQLPCPDVVAAESSFGPCTESDFLWIETWVSGPVAGGPGECCYEVIANGTCGIGRPYATEQGALVAKASRRDDWKAQSRANTTQLTDEEREALVAAWTRDGLYEHASVASFSRFALELMSVGAPPDLVADAHRAALDEIEHARLCFALASQFAGSPIGPDAFPIDENAAVRTDLAAIAAATAAEGCIGETLAAALAGAQRDAATDADVRAALTTIAEDESRHAELAWRTVAWALKNGGAEVREAVSKVFANARKHMIPAACDVTLPSHGLLAAKEQAHLQMKVLTEVIGPCAHALLG